MSNLDFYSAAQVWSLNPPSFTEDNLRGQYGSFQASATTAAQLEVLVGNGLKAGRIVGGTCVGTPSYYKQLKTPETCKAAGGSWRAPALDDARAFIQDPTVYIDKWLAGVINANTSNDLNPNYFWFALGGSLGNFLLNSLTSSNAKPALNEDPQHAYIPSASSEPALNAGLSIDIDGDGEYDAYDSDGDGTIDYCIFDGTPPAGCVGSATITTPDSGTGQADIPAPADALSKHSDQSGVVAQVKADLTSQGFDFNGSCGAFEITKRVAWQLKDSGAGLLSKPSGNNCNGYAVAIIAYSDGYIYKILSDASEDGFPTGTNGPQWVPDSCGTDGTCSDRYRSAIQP
jgi:hypothetical protein